MAQRPGLRQHNVPDALREHRDRIRILERLVSRNSSGASGFDTVYKAPGSLLYLYRMGDTFPFPAVGQTTDDTLLDTAFYDATQRNLTYFEYNTSGGWTTANRPTLHSIERPSMEADDGLTRWTADGAVGEGGSFPGAMFYRPADAVYNLTKTWLAWFNPDPSASRTVIAGIARNSLICGTWQGVGGGLRSGSGLFYDFVNDRFFFEHAGPGAAFDIFGPSGMPRGEIYLVAVTWDGATFTLWINAVAVATHASSDSLFASGSFFRLGGTINTAGTGGHFAVGGIDDVSGWATPLTEAEQAAIFANGSVTAPPPIVGSFGVPGAISSVVGGVDAAANLAIVSDGAGGTTFGYPAIKVYLRGA